MKTRFASLGSATLLLALISSSPAQNRKAPATPAAPPKIDEEYTKLINDYLQDPRITTELVDHMPASDTVPSPLKFFGRIPGTPGELTYAKDIDRYYEELAQRFAAREVLEARHRPKRAATRWCWPSPTKPPSRRSRQV